MKKYTDNNGINKFIDLCGDEYKEKTFNINFNIQQLYALHKVLNDYLKDYNKEGGSSGPSTIIYKSKNRKNKYYTYMIMGYKGKNNLFKFDSSIINDIFKATMLIFIEIDIKNYTRINLICYRINTRNQKIESIIDQNIDRFFERVKLDIQNIIDSIYNAEYTDAGIRKYLGMTNRELIGYYNTKYFEIDAGGKCKYPSFIGKKIKIKHKYQNILINNKYDDSSITIYMEDIYGNVIKKILELILRTKFKDINNQKYVNNFLKEENIGTNQFEFDKLIVGNSTILEDNFEDIKFELDDNENIVGLPKNVDDIIDKFFELSNKEKEVFYNSCKSYEKALDSSGMERLFHLFKAIENIVAYEEKYTNNLKETRKKNMQILIERYVKNRNFENTIDWWYELRNKYAHNGIDYEGIFDFIFMPDFPVFRNISSDRYYKAEDYLEVLVHFVLLNWLKQQSIAK